ncbi:hypothetical protein OIU76_016032 [Salix suchowensis]|nr:hypothetical protein OIU76_016032 [Salix suchowensis]
MVSFGMEDFAEKYGGLKPSQFVDVMALMGDKSDNIPGVEGIGVVHAVELISRFGTLENLLKCVDQVEGESIRKTLKENANRAVLSKELAKLRCELPEYMVPFATTDLIFKKPEVCTLWLFLFYFRSFLSIFRYMCGLVREAQNTHTLFMIQTWPKISVYSIFVRQLNRLAWSPSQN